MLVIQLNEEKYEYDVHALVQAFYPEEQVKVLTPAGSEEKRAELSGLCRMKILVTPPCAEFTMDEQSFIWRAPDGEDFKAGYKKFLYRTLCELTGKELPWGNLIGIRPTKLAYGLLEQGKSDEEILEFYRKEHFTSEKKAQLSIEIAKR